MSAQEAKIRANWIIMAARLTQTNPEAIRDAVVHFNPADSPVCSVVAYLHDGTTRDSGPVSRRAYRIAFPFPEVFAGYDAATWPDVVHESFKDTE